MLELWRGWFWVVFVLQAEACILSSLCVGALVRLVLDGIRFCRLNPVFSVRCVLDLWCGWFWVVFILQAEACILSSLCVGALVRLVLGGVHFGG